MFAVTAHSQDPAPHYAVRDLIESATESGVSNPDLAVLFVSHQLDPKPIVEGLNRHWSGLRLIGCSADGEMSNAVGASSSSAVVLFIDGARANIQIGVCRDLSNGPTDAAREGWAAMGPRSGFAPDVGLLFADASAVSGDETVRALQDEAGGRFPFYGGIAAQHDGDSYQFYGAEVLQGAAVYALLEGVVYASGIDSGWKSLTGPAHVTGAISNWVYSIDGRPALEWYCQYLPALGTILGQHPLIVDATANNSGRDRVLRCPLTWDNTTGAIQFAGDVPEGAAVDLATVRRGDMLDAALTVSERAREAYGRARTPELALLFSCASRAHILGTRTYRELDAIREQCGVDVPIAGAYLLGEFGPAAYDSANPVSRLHNKTVVPLLLGDRGG